MLLGSSSSREGDAARSLSRAEIVAAARDAIAHGSKSFAAASKLFDPKTRERAWLLYAWCRACDDIADGQELGHGMTRVADAQARLSRMRVLTAQALRGEPTGEAPFDALGVVARECGIPDALPHDVIAGFELDAAEWQPRSEADLYRYCYHVAGAVGVMMAIVMGVAPDDDAVLTRACDLGLAFQLANIARDICEDESVGRCYLPLDWLAEMDVPPGEHMKPPYRKRLAVLAKRLADRAAAFEDSAREGAAALPFRSAWAVLAAAGIYGGIAREVVRRGDHAWDRRVATTRSEKLGWIARACWQTTKRGTWHDPPRPALWRRPI